MLYSLFLLTNCPKCCMCIIGLKLFLISKLWVQVPVQTLVSLCKTLNHYCFILQMGRKAVGPVCYLILACKGTQFTFITQRRGVAPIFLAVAVESYKPL